MCRYPALTMSQPERGLLFVIAREAPPSEPPLPLLAQLLLLSLSKFDVLMTAKALRVSNLEHWSGKMSEKINATSTLVIGSRLAA